MKVKIKKETEVTIKTLKVRAGVRYWEDAKIGDIEDEEGKLIPCRNGDNWEPIIDIDTGIITNWEKGKTADIHYKVCDDGTYELLDKNGIVVIKKDGYVINALCPNEEGFGDYIIIAVDENGKIENWRPNFDDILTGGED